MLRRSLMVEVLRPFLAWTVFLCVLLFVMAFLKGSELILGSATSATDLGRLAVFMVPQFLTQAVPIAFLLAILLGLGRLAEDGELTALQALGVSLAEVARAPILLGVLLTGVAAFLTSTAQPWGQRMVRQAANDILRRNLMKDLKPGTFHEEVQGLMLYTGGGEAGGRLKQVLVHDERDPERPLLVLAADGAVEESSWENLIDFELDDGAVHRASRESDEYALVTFRHASILAGIGGAYLQRNQLYNVRDQQTPWELRAAAQAAGERGEDPRPYLTTLHWRLGQMLMPFSFGVLGAPLAIGRRRGGRAWGALLTLTGYVGFYLISRLAVQLADAGSLPPAMAGLLPNVLYVGTGLLLLWGMVKRGVR